MAGLRRRALAGFGTMALVGAVSVVGLPAAAVGAASAAQDASAPRAVTHPGTTHDDGAAVGTPAGAASGTAAADTTAASDGPPAPATTAASGPDGAPGAGSSDLLAPADPGDFAEAAADLPEGLVRAVEQDLGMTSEEYLALAETAATTSQVTEQLTAEGVDVLGSQVTAEGVTLYVASEQDAATVQALGADAVVGEPQEAAAPPPALRPRPRAAVQGGWRLGLDENGDGRLDGACSTGFVGYDASGRAVLGTAGHCDPAADGLSENTSVTLVDLARPTIYGANSYYGTGGRTVIGAWRSSATTYSSDPRAAAGADVPANRNWPYDSALVALAAGTQTAAAVGTWDGGSNDAGAGSGTPVTVTDYLADPPVGTPVCKSGATSGWQCGRVLMSDVHSLNWSDVSSGVYTDVCTLPGDSGGTAVAGTRAVGVTSNGDWENFLDYRPYYRSGTDPCDRTQQLAFYRDYYVPRVLGHSPGTASYTRAVRYLTSSVGLNTVFFPVGSGSASLKSAYGSGFQLAVRVGAPTMSTRLAPTGTATVTGTVPGGGIRHTVALTVEGATYRARVGADGTWSASVKLPRAGTLAWSAVASYDTGSFSRSATASGTVQAVTPLAPTLATRGTTLARNQTFTGRGQAGARITLTMAKRTTGTATRSWSATVGAAGTWSLRATAVPYGGYTLKISQTYLGTVKSLAAKNVKIPPPAPRMSARTAYVVGGTFTGRALAGATVRVTLTSAAGTKVVRTRADASGVWRMTVPKVRAGTWRVSLTQAVNATVSPESAARKVTVKAAAKR